MKDWRQSKGFELLGTRWKWKYGNEICYWLKFILKLEKMCQGLWNVLV